MLAYHFPPLGGAGVQRNMKFVRYLGDYGWNATVITGAGERDAPWAPPDDSLMHEIPSDIRIKCIPGPEPALRTGYRAACERLLGLLPPRTRSWIDQATKLGREESEIDVIYASLIPYETAEAAARLSAAIGRPWVADLQDPWALDEMWLYPTALHRRNDMRRMRGLLSTASAVVMNTQEAATRLLSAFPELSSRTIVIPNGFDSDDFAAGSHERDPRAPFRIVHTGYLYTEAGLRVRRTARLRKLLGGFLMPIDIYPRSHAYLVEALDLLLDRNPQLAGAFELHLAGSLSRDDARVSASRPYVRAHGYLAHRDSVELLTSADLLFLPMHDVPDGMRAGIVPGKTYEYLGSGRPILAAVPAGDAADLLAQIPNAAVCSPKDVLAMSLAVERAITNSRDASVSPRSEDADRLVSSFERRQLTRTLAEVLTEVAERGVNPMGKAAGVAPRPHPAHAAASTGRRIGRALTEHGVKGTARRVARRSLAPAFAPVAAASLRRRVARRPTMSEKIDVVYDFDVFGIKLPPWQDRQELEQLLTILQSRRLRTVVEIGTGNGGTFFLLSQAAQPGALVVSVDLPGGEFGGGYPLWRSFFYRGFATRGQRIALLRKDSHTQDTYEEMKRVLGGHQIDFLLIDGDHSYSGVKCDFEMYSRLVAPDGLIAFHDVVPGPSIPDRFRDRHGDDISCVGDVPRFWRELAAQFPTTELVADWSQARFGIGLLEARELAIVHPAHEAQPLKLASTQGA